MKIVINRCFGGFSLSHAAVMAYAKRKGIEMHAFVNDRSSDGRINFNKMVPYRAGEDAFLIHYSTAPLGPDGKIPDAAYFSDRDIARDDADLVAVVKELGKKANGSHASLAVVTIPDDVEWEIDEYDGSETIDEKHRSWC